MAGELGKAEELSARLVCDSEKESSKFQTYNPLEGRALPF